MKKEMSSSLAKRMLFFTKVIVTLMVICILIFINFLDLKEKNIDSRHLKLVKDVFSKSNELGFQNFELERVEYLENNNPALAKDHLETRDQLVAALDLFGFRINREGKGDGENDNRFMMMFNAGLQRQLEKDFNNWNKGRFRDVIPSYETDGTGVTIDSAILVFNRYAIPDKVWLLKGLDTALLLRTLDSAVVAIQKEKKKGIIPITEPGLKKTGDSLPPAPEPINRFSLFNDQDLTELYITKTNLVILYHERLEPEDQRGPERYVASIPIAIDSVEFPSTLHFAGFDDEAVNELANDKKRQRKLKDAYGYYELPMIETLSKEALAKNNDAVSILGFDVSRKWFPLAMFLVLLVIYWMLYETVNSAKKTRSRIISGYSSDEALEFLVDRKSIRFFLWVLTPLLLIFFVVYASLIRYDDLVYGLIILSGVSCSVLGILCYKISGSL